MSQHQFGERFALMWYACKCGHRERIWNSRNGVTPFGLGCPSCGEATLLHADWHLDECSPEHRLHKEQRYFADGTVEEAVAAIERRITIFAERGHAVPEDVAAVLRKEAREQTGEWPPGWPAIRRYEGGAYPSRAKKVGGGRYA